MKQLSPSSAVYGVVLNDSTSLKALGDLSAAPYKEAPKAPVLYIKPFNTWSAYDAEVRLPQGEDEVEVGATIGLVLGRDATSISESEATGALAGIVLAADLSLPHGSYYRPAIREKCFDGSLPLGPIHPLSDLSSTVLRVEVNGKDVDEWWLGTLLRSPARLLAEVSTFMTLRAGDVLLVGVRYNAPRAARGSRVCIYATGMAPLAFEIAKEQQ